MPVYILGYREFLDFRGIDDSEASVLDYLKVGGLPALMHFDISDEGQVSDYIFGVYNTVMLRDVIARENIRNIRFIHNLSRYIADNIGKLFFLRNIGNTLKAQGVSRNSSSPSPYVPSF